MPERTKVRVNLSVLFNIVHSICRCQSKEGEVKEVMGFLGGMVKEKNNVKEIKILKCYPAVEEEFMEKPFSSEVFEKGKAFSTSLRKEKETKGELSVVGWYHTHSKGSPAMSIMDKINHISLLDATIIQEEENEVEGKMEGGVGIISGSCGGVALIFSPSLFLRKVPFPGYLKIYYYNTSKKSSFFLSNFEELRSYNIQTDIDESLDFVKTVTETSISSKNGKESRKREDKITPKSENPLAAQMKKKKWKHEAEKKLTREKMQGLIKKEGAVERSIAEIRRMIKNDEDISEITERLKKAKLYLEKFMLVVQKEEKVLRFSTSEEEKRLHRECKVLMHKLKEHNIQLDKIISEMYYKVLAELAEENVRF